MEPRSSTEEFWTRYAQLCIDDKVCPLKSVVRYLKGNELCCAVEAIRQEHWKYLLIALSTDNTLSKIHFSSDLPPFDEMVEMVKKQKRHYPFPYGILPNNIANICTTLSLMLPISSALKVLKFENLYLTLENAEILSQALRISYIEHFSLAGTQVTEESIEIICRGLYVSEVKWVDFSSCSLGIISFQAIAAIIKSHKLRRQGELFPSTLRNNAFPILDSMKGLSRVSLNDNYLGCRGTAIILEPLQDDLWIKALDFQLCNIDEDGAQIILDTLTNNVELELIDLRQNDIKKKEDNMTKIDFINAQLALNRSGKATKYQLGPLWRPMKTTSLKPKVPRPKVLKKSASRTKGRKDSKSLGNAIRISYSIINDIGLILKDQGTQTDNEFVEHIKTISRALTNEMTMRHCVVHLLKKSRAENGLLRKELEKLASKEDLIYIDNDTFLEVKQTFEKFKKFLGIMKKYGLWEFIAMLGVNENAEFILEPLLNDSSQKIKVVEKIPNDSVHICENPSTCFCQSRAPQPVPTKQRCCSNCRRPDCNIKPKDVPEAPNSKLISDSSKVNAQKVFKELQESHSQSPPSKQPQKVHKMSANCGKNSVMKKLYKVEVPSRIKQFKSTKDLYDAVRKDMAMCEFCKVDHGSTACSVSKTKSAVKSAFVKNVSSQTPHPAANRAIPTTCTTPSSIKSHSALINSLLRPSGGSSSSKGPSSSNKTVTSPTVKESVTSTSSVLVQDSASEDLSSVISDNLSQELSKSLKRKRLEVSATHSSSVSGESSKPNDSTSIKSKGQSPKTNLSNSSQSLKTRRKRDDGSPRRRAALLASYVELIGNPPESERKKNLQDLIAANQLAKANSRSTEGEGSKESTISNHSKSSKKSSLQKKYESSSRDVKHIKKTSSDSSLPSLSDITTVSSKSLNTDSIMNQLSES